jgi:hypothetical protein
LLITFIMGARHQLLDTPVILNDPVVLDLVPEARDSLFSNQSQVKSVSVSWEKVI